MQIRSESPAEERKQFVLIGRWLDYLSRRIRKPPTRLKKEPAGNTGDDLDGFEESLGVLARDTSLSGWFWLGAVVFLNIIVAIVQWG